MRVVIILFLLLVVGLPVQARSKHYFFNGLVRSISDSSINVDGREFPLAYKIQVLSQTQNKGAFTEHKAQLSDVYRGLSVTVRVEGASVNQIVIEEWKK
ncbi:MAG: hypothetical protein GJT30_14485 [Geobacter sp.]|nr:hypothetical protein [Geobacter sp.]